MRKQDERIPMAKSSAKKAAPKAERPKHNDEQYGEVLHSLSYEFNSENYFNAAGLVGSSRMQQYITVASMGLLLLIIASLYDQEHPLYPGAIAGFILFLLLSITANRWPQLRDAYLKESTLALTEDTHRHVVVTPGEIIVEGPGEEVNRYPISQIKKIAEDSDGALVKLGAMRYVYIPRKSVSETRYRALLKTLRNK